MVSAYTVIIFLVAATLALGEAASSRPNIVFVLADDYGYNDIGYHNSRIKTPTLDQLALDGVKLENYYVQPICTPTRSQLMSGRYQIHTGLQHGIIWGEQANGLPLDTPTIADMMKQSGYATHMVGKWHLGFYKEDYLPWHRGFDSYFGYLEGSEDYYTHKHAYGRHHKMYLDLWDNAGPVKDQTGNYSAQIFTDCAVDIINKHDADKPMFMYLAYQSVHAPLQVPERYLDQYKHIQDKDRRIYAAMTSALDEGVANVTKALKARGLWDNTIFIFSTDNGGQVLAGGNNFPLRGWKGSLWEGGVHGVGFVSGGALAVQGVVNRELIHVSDWFPTILSMANGSLNGRSLSLDGVDQWETISMGKASQRKVLLHNIDILTEKTGYPLYNDTFDTSVRAAVRMGHMKLLTGSPGIGQWVPPPEDSKLLFQPKPETVKQDKNVWLFNITADPTEHYDLSDQMPEVVHSMLELLKAFNDTAVPPRFPPMDPRSNPALHGGVWGPWE